MKRILKILFVAFTIVWANVSVSLAQDYNNPKYLKGAVPEVNGNVVFSQSYKCEGRTQKQIFDAIETYTKHLVNGKGSLPQCRIMQLTPEDGTIVASLEEVLTFKSTNWVLDTARVFYHLVFTVHDGGFDVTIRRVRYIYGPMETTDVSTVLAAEDWITDSKALNKKGLLTKVGGKKFRRCTIDRKDTVFQGAYDAVMK